MPRPPFSIFSPGDKRCLWAHTWDPNKEVNSRFGQAVKLREGCESLLQSGVKECPGTSSLLCHLTPLFGADAALNRLTRTFTRVKPRLGSFSSQLSGDRCDRKIICCYFDRGSCLRRHLFKMAFKIFTVALKKKNCLCSSQRVTAPPNWKHRMTPFLSWVTAGAKFWS